MFITHWLCQYRWARAQRLRCPLGNRTDLSCYRVPVLCLEFIVDLLQLALGLVDAPLLEQVLDLRDPSSLGLIDLLLTGTVLALANRLFLSLWAGLGRSLAEQLSLNLLRGDVAFLLFLAHYEVS